MLIISFSQWLTKIRSVFSKVKAIGESIHILMQYYGKGVVVVMGGGGDDRNVSYYLLLFVDAFRETGLYIF